MIFAVLVFATCQALVFTVFAAIGLRWYGRERQRIADELQAALRSFIQPPDSETPSPLAVILDNAATLLAARMVQQVKAMLAGIESGEAKGQQLALIEEVSSKNPWVALLSNILPRRIRNGLMKNPQMLGALSSLGGNHRSDSEAPYVRKHRE